MASAAPVAIVGMAVLLPGAPDLDTYWHNLVNGTDSITEAPGHRWDAAHYPERIYCRRGGFVDAYATVDAARFGVMPDSVPGMEPDQLIALQVASRALADAGGEERLPDRDRIGVILGRGGYLTSGQARHDQRVRTGRQLVRTLGELLPELGADRLARVAEAFDAQLGPDRPESAIGLVPNLAAARVANRLDLRGPAYTTDAACASSLIAVDQAIAELTTGRCDLMLAGGVHHCHDITLWSVFARLGALSRSERSRPFHAGADGILIGEGTAIVVLKRLTDAERDGDRIYAVIRGTGVTADGRAAALASPDPGGQTRAVRQAWRAAGLDPQAPDALGLLEAHGTGTPIGDAAELVTLSEVFGPRRGEPSAVIGSVKSMIGHTMPAAGAASLVKAALALHHGTLLPTLNCEDPHPHLARTRFQPIAEARPWPGAARRAAVNAFGFGGINAHLVLEQAPEAGVTRAAAPTPTLAASAAPSTAHTLTDVREPERVLRLTADTPELLARALDREDAALLAQADTDPLEGRTRLAVVAPDAKRLALARRAVAKGRAWRGRGDVWFTPEPLLTPSAGGQLAFVFPGLEAEFTPRLAEVAQHFRLPYTETEGAVVGDVARHGIGVLAVGRVLDSALRALGIEPDAVAGHSIGEWSAMLAGGLYDTSTADELLAGFDPDALRVPGVVFAALGAPAHQVEGWLGRRSDVVLSHDNAPGQAMICGPRPAVEEVVQEAREQRIVAQILPFRSGFHTPMLAPYLGPLTEGVRRAPVREARVPVWSGTTAEPFPAAPEEVRELFVRHLVEPVRFRQLTESMYAAGCRAFVQVGGGQLGSLIADTLHSRDVLTVAAGASRRGGLAQLRRVVSALWSEGRPGAGAALSRGLASSDSAASAASLRPARGALSRPSVPPVRLDLGAASVSLPHPVRSELRAELLAALGRSSKSGETDGRLDGLAERFPAVAELRAALTETAETAVTLFAGAGQRRDSTTTGGRTVELTPQPVAARAGTPAAGSPGRTGLPPAEARVIPLWDGVAPRGGIPAGGGTPAVSGSIASGGGPADGGASTDGAAPADGGGHEPACRSHLRVSVDEMPYLIDHCFIPQRPGWPELSDRHPVVPATTALRHMMDAAERAFPGRRAIAAYDVRFEKWLTAEPATLVEAVVTPEPDSSRVRVNFGPYARAVLELAEVYPERPRTPWRCGQAERACEIDAADLYRDRWMFHGPAFQGVTQLTGIGDAHIRGTITVPTAPGALLDNVGQLLGYWILAQHTERRVVFPVGMRGFRFFGPEPPPGTEVECHVKITSITRSVLTADIQLVKDGTVWAQITGWQDRRFTVMSADLPGGYPERLALSEARLGGWTLLTDRWHDLASRGLAMRTHLGAAERAAFGGHPPRGRRQWLLGRIAAKDAVRHWLWQQGEGAVFPAEIEIRNDSEGQPYAVGVHGRDLPPLDLSLAHKADAAVALVRPSAEREHPDTGVGIDIELVTERTEATHRIALNAQERELLAELGESAGEGEEVWFTRFWAAKEAAAKAEGHGLRGRPREFTVLSASPYGLLVDSRRQRHHVRCEHITTSVPGSPHHRYVVAWTTKEYSL